MFGGSGADQITTGAGRDIVFGDHALYEGNAQTGVPVSVRSASTDIGGT